MSKWHNLFYIHLARNGMANFSQKYNEVGFWAVITAGVSPIPFKVVTIMSGATNQIFWVCDSIISFSRNSIFYSRRSLEFHGHEIKNFIEIS